MSNKTEAKKHKSIAYQVLNKYRTAEIYHANKEYSSKKAAEIRATRDEDIISQSVSSEPWGHDEIRYKFKDNSYLLYRSIFDEWQL
jgi:hypothetical protein